MKVKSLENLPPDGKQQTIHPHLKSLSEKNETLLSVRISQDQMGAKKIREKTVNKLLVSKPEKIARTHEASSQQLLILDKDLQTSYLSGWLSHFSDIDRKVRRHFWRLKNDLITLFLSESESLFFKQIMLSSIQDVKTSKKGRQLILVLNDTRLTIFPDVDDAGSCKKIIDQWRRTVKAAIEEARGRSEHVTSVEDEVQQNMEGVFVGMQLALDLDGSSFNEKKNLRELITRNGGQILYIITINTRFLVVCKESKSKRSNSYKGRKAMKMRIPVVDEEFIRDCVKQGRLLESDVLRTEAKENFMKGKILTPILKPAPEKTKKFNIGSVSRYKVDGEECPDFPEDFRIPKYSLLELIENEVKKIVCVETHIATLGKHKEHERMYRAMVSTKFGSDKVLRIVYPLKTVSELIQCYETLVKSFTSEGMKRVPGLSNPEFSDVVSEPLALVLCEKKCSAGIIHPEVIRLVESVWADSIGELKTHLGVDPANISPDQVRNAMIALLKIQEALKKDAYNESMAEEFYRYVTPRDSVDKTPIDTILKVAKKRELCQLLKDIVTTNESSWLSTETLSSLSQYIALKCAITWLDPKGREFKTVRDLLPDSDEKLQYKICNIFKINRTTENIEFRQDLGDEKLLFHASAASNFVGIFSRGLLMPHTAVSEIGISRHDKGKLGSGVYFSDSFRLSSAFAKTSEMRGTRLMLVNGVMLGDIYETKEPKTDLMSPPEGFHSVKGVGITVDGANEYAIYSINQQRMRYVIEFTLGDETAIAHVTKPLTMPLLDYSAKQNDTLEAATENMDPKLKSMQYGLVMEAIGATAKLEEVHTRAKIIDLVSEVTIFQSYRNMASDVVEAKYVFPLKDDSAVCGFEAFINEKHMVGVVKEKEEAHREYKKAVAEGHGAYLMDEEKPNVFTVSIGNIPPHAKVIIKITYISELETVNYPDSSVLFSLPASITQRQKDEMLLTGSITQSTTKSAAVSKQGKSSFMVSIDMPFDIIDIKCQTHKITSKKTATKACVKLQKSEVLADKDFRLLIKVAEIHVPRIWIETSGAEKDGDQVAMVTFFPEFDFDAMENFSCSVLLDTSNSMHGTSASHSKYISLMLIDKLPEESRFNVVSFGSNFVESFVGFENSAPDTKLDAKQFVARQSCHGGSDLLQLLDSFDLLLESSCSQDPHNIFLISDGYFSEDERILKLANQISKKSLCQTRIFTLGIGSSINSHLLQSISILTGGWFEHFSPSTKNTWKAQLQKLIDFASQPVLTDVQIDWCNYENTEFSEGTIMNVPKQLKCVFAGSRLTSYSFLPGCTKATLNAKIHNQEFSTVVAAHALSHVEGKTLHRLAAKAIFKEYENERLAEDSYVDQVVRDRSKSSLIKLSIKHAVISKFTSFIAVEKRERNEDMSLASGPLISELVELAFNDIIPEISWEVEERSAEEKIDELLKRSAQLQSSSILQARELALQAKALYDSLRLQDVVRLLQVHASLCRLGLADGRFDPSDTLMDVFKINADGPSYEVLNLISNDRAQGISDAVQELAGQFLPDDCTVQLASLPKILRPSAVGLFLGLHNLNMAIGAKFTSSAECMADFWKKLHDINVGDGNKLTADIMKQLKTVEARTRAALSHWSKRASENVMLSNEVPVLPNVQFAADRLARNPRLFGETIAAPLFGSKVVRKSGGFGDMEFFSGRGVMNNALSQTRRPKACLDSRAPFTAGVSKELHRSGFGKISASLHERTSLDAERADLSSSPFVLNSSTLGLYHQRRSSSAAIPGGKAVPQTDSYDSLLVDEAAATYRGARLIPSFSAFGYPQRSSSVVISGGEAFRQILSVDSVPLGGGYGFGAQAEATFSPRKSMFPAMGKKLAPPSHNNKKNTGLDQQDVAKTDQPSSPKPLLRALPVRSCFKSLQSSVSGTETSLKPFSLLQSNKTGLDQQDVAKTDHPPAPEPPPPMFQRQSDFCTEPLQRHASGTVTSSFGHQKKHSSANIPGALGSPPSPPEMTTRDFASLSSSYDSAHLPKGFSFGARVNPATTETAPTETAEALDSVDVKKKKMQLYSALSVLQSLNSELENEIPVQKLEITAIKGSESKRLLRNTPDHYRADSIRPRSFCAQNLTCTLDSLEARASLPIDVEEDLDELSWGESSDCLGSGLFDDVCDDMPINGLHDLSSHSFSSSDAESDLLENDERLMYKSNKFPRDFHRSSCHGDSDDPLFEAFTLIRLLKLDKDGALNECFVGLEPGNYWEFPSDDDEPETKIFQEIKNIVVLAGGRSLGLSCFTIALNMVLTAVLLQVVKVLQVLMGDKDSEKKISAIENWLKRTDAETPLLYQRLELGSSWEAAARNVIKKIVEVMRGEVRGSYSSSDSSASS